MEILKLWAMRLSSHPWGVPGKSFQVATCVCGILPKMDSLPFQVAACRCFGENISLMVRGEDS